MQTPLLNHEEEILFRNVIRTQDFDAFTDRYFTLPMSGTWFTPEDRGNQWKTLLSLWYETGEPEEHVIAEAPGGKAEFQVFHDPYYGNEPIFLQRHGFRTMPWMREFLSPGITRSSAVTGRGSGKTGGAAIRGLAYCALFPGFRFLNVAVTQYQADLMLGEIEKWVLNSEFKKFIKRSRGTNPLWTMKPYPIITVEVYPGQPSTFICQTIGIEGKSIIGGERDWINVDESQLLESIGEVHPILVTSLRGTRISGVPRWTKLSWISNPGFNPEWLTLIEGYKERQDKGDKNVLVLEELATDLNIYITKRQIIEQEKSLTEREQDRWMSGIATQLYSDSPFSEESIESCRNDALTEQVDKVGKFHDSFGLLEYELPYEDTHTYVVAGDVGKSHLTSMNAQNVPVIMVFDITDFMERPSRVVAFYWMDGQNTYETFEDKFIYACMKYRARSYYDATNIQSAFEDVGGFKDLPATQPVFFSGEASKKKYAVAVASLMMQNGMFEWPYIKGLWHQCRVYNPSSRKVPDDIVATILVFIFALQGEATLWTKFIERFRFDTDAKKTLDIKGGADEMEDDWPDVEAPVKYDRYSRIHA